MSNDKTDLELIQQTVQYYIDGLYHSDIEKIKKLFIQTHKLSDFSKEHFYSEQPGQRNVGDKNLRLR